MWNVGPKDPAEMANELDTLVLDAFFLPQNSEILQGKVTLTVNSAIRKEFPIPPQVPFDPVITSVISNNVVSGFGVGQGGRYSVMLVRPN